MQPLTPKDLWPLPVYEGVRDQFRKEVIAAKKDRRVQVGPSMTFVFENRTTVKFQVQEILRIERITGPEEVAEELEGFRSEGPAGAGRALHDVRLREPDHGEVPGAGDFAHRADHRAGGSGRGARGLPIGRTGGCRSGPP